MVLVQHLGSLAAIPVLMVGRSVHCLVPTRPAPLPRLLGDGGGEEMLCDIRLSDAKSPLNGLELGGDGMLLGVANVTWSRLRLWGGQFRSCRNAAMNSFFLA